MYMYIHRAVNAINYATCTMYMYTYCTCVWVGGVSVFHSPLIPYSRYFSGGGDIFVIFVVERRTTNFFTHETVPHSTGVWFSILRP